MPKFNATTKEAKEIWKKGDRTISEVILEVDGKLTKAKTYSNVVAKPGFVGEVESYEKDGRNGAETFVRQAPKEEGDYSQSGYSQGGSKPSYGARPQGDNYTMYLSYAKDIAVALINNGDFKLEALEDILPKVANGGDFLHNHHSEGSKLAQDANQAFDKEELNGLFDSDSEAPAEEEIPQLGA